MTRDEWKNRLIELEDAIFALHDFSGEPETLEYLENCKKVDTLRDKLVEDIMTLQTFWDRKKLTPWGRAYLK